MPDGRASLGWSGPWPYIPGAEFAGLVEGHSGDEAGFHDGEPVYGYPSLTGCYAQYVACPAERLAPIPAGLARTDAAAHREIEKGHTRGKLVLIVDEDLAATMEL